ncbi:hypothetical protein OIO90_005403 [Microbotryomycetes sp. JL221]|nr:hypothetical protein OIO90_005403 [Microbotryomycetes sp. JL221]
MPVNGPTSAAVRQSAVSRPKSHNKSASSSSKRSNRPSQNTLRRQNSMTPEDSGSDSSASDDEDSDSRRQAMLLALERHQQSFLADALPKPSSSMLENQNTTKRKGKQVANKPIWEMDLQDLEQEDDDESDDDDENDSQDSDREQADEEPTQDEPIRRVAEVAVFTDPTKVSNDTLPSMFTSDQGPGPEQTAGTRKAMKEFMSSKVKSMHKTKSVADIANAKKLPKSKSSSSQVQAGVDPEEEAHLASLDSHLSNLIRPLTQPGSSTSQLPQLLSDLPLAPTKLMKGSTPLPKNAPRSMRAGQSAANLKRALKRDEASGVVAGSKRGIVGGREALTKREQRLQDEGGEIKRQRGMKGAIGRLGGGELKLSKSDIELGMNGGRSTTQSRDYSGGRAGGGRGGKAKRGRR